MSCSFPGAKILSLTPETVLLIDLETLQGTGYCGVSYQKWAEIYIHVSHFLSFP
jgi:hypothetical protein